MDEPTSLTDLRDFDDMTRVFWPLGLSGALMAPEDSLRFLRDSIECAHLIADVPEDVRNNFARVRKTFPYGLMEYDLFTAAADPQSPNSPKVNWGGKCSISATAVFA
jgi:hypothetical protein